jgi:hypothetical protein
VEHLFGVRGELERLAVTRRCVVRARDRGRR